ncbi:hypothetical protein [Moritella sp.]|nr:hypothetical protein [Moritella sp.]MCJ8348561.1 hypothetical protein [Moritella sp.]NQZ39074.1 hypothetical protein [Moritella sp.]
MHTIFTLLISAFSFNSFALDSTYLQSYGVKDSFESSYADRTKQGADPF